MKMSISDVTLRRIVVIFLAILVIAAAFFFVSTLWSNIEYMAARSLAADNPIYGNTSNDIVVIEQQYANRYPIGVVFAAGVQMILVILISFAILRWLYQDNTTRPVPMKCGDCGDLNDCIKVVKFNEYKKIIEEFERGC